MWSLILYSFPTCSEAIQFAQDLERAVSVVTGDLLEEGVWSVVQEVAREELEWAKERRKQELEKLRGVVELKRTRRFWKRYVHVRTYV